MLSTRTLFAAFSLRRALLPMMDAAAAAAATLILPLFALPCRHMFDAYDI